MKKFLKKFVMSYYYAFCGIIGGLKERSMIVHLFAAAVVITLSIVLKISKTEWLFIIFAIMLVLSSELFNTSIESVCNENRDQLGASYDATRKARDVAAGAVLINAMGAAVIGGVIFIPKILSLL